MRGGGSQSKRVPSPKKLRVQQPRGRRQPEREGDDREGEPAPPQHRQPDQRRHRGADQPGAEEPEARGPSPSRAVIEPPTAAPTATNAICPRLTSPAQPVSTTSDSAITA